ETSADLRSPAAGCRRRRSGWRCARHCGHHSKSCEILPANSLRGTSTRWRKNAVTATKKRSRRDSTRLRQYFPAQPPSRSSAASRSEEHTSELQSRSDLVCRLLLEKKKHDHERQQP